MQTFPDREWDRVWIGANIATMVAGGEPYGNRTNAALAVKGERIAWIGPAAEATSKAEAQKIPVENCQGLWMTPGLIDCHTHLVYGGNRVEEFEKRLCGVSYEEIARAGGGIQSTVNATRAAGAESLLGSAMVRAKRLMSEGVTTIEIKSGYGLELAAERRLLEVARELGRQLPLSVKTTYLGLHALPQEFHADRAGFVARTSGPWLEALAGAGLVDAVDAFCENIAFTLAETEQFLRAAKGLGLPAHVHAGQLTDMGAAELAAKYDALSADHLEYLSAGGASALAASDTVAVLLPGAYFTLEATASGSRARAARLRTLHNEVLTPTFMPVGTHAAVRAQRREDLLESGVQVLLANTYHLMLRPGIETFEKFGGLHSFMNWPRSVLTDSGGFQIFSLPGSRTMQEECAEFKSYVDQTTIRLSPESSIAAQKAIGSDIMMVLDQCVPSTVERGIAQQAMELTHRWAQRSLAARGDSPQAMFGIVQGASYADLRAASARAITQLPFDGFAIGGLAVGEGSDEREECTAIVTELLPEDRPRYLMGVGTTRDLLEAVHRGVDMFDCILPTALAKQGVAFTSLGRRDLRRAAYRDMAGPIDPACTCYTCRTFSIAYLFHLNRVREAQGWQLLGLHNIHFYMQLMRRMREHILADTWLSFYRSQRDVLDARDSYGRPATHVTKAQRQKLKLKLGRYEVIVRDDVGHIRDMTSGEVMHSVNVPAEEARSLYVEQSRLIRRLNETEAAPLVVWDVGLGAAANAMAAIQAVEALHADQTMRPGRRLTLVSFENDLDSLILALRHPAWFKHLRHAAPRQLLAENRWSSATAGVDWLLLRGDFRVSKFDAPLPDVIFFDPFSFKTDSALWTLTAFRELANLFADKAVELFTYSYSTSVRAAMLAAGFYVAKGRSTGPKAETTIALSPRAAERAHDRELLGGEWLGKWRRSDAQAPMGAGAEIELWREAVSVHPQFRQS